jgi:hypothetical protein
MEITDSDLDDVNIDHLPDDLEVLILFDFKRRIVFSNIPPNVKMIFIGCLDVNEVYIPKVPFGCKVYEMKTSWLNSSTIRQKFTCHIDNYDCTKFPIIYNNDFPCNYLYELKIVCKMKMT